MTHQVVFQNRISIYPSTVLIPLALEKNLKYMRKKYGSIRGILRMAVSRNFRFYSRSPRNGTAKIKYQEKGQELIRLNFRPYDEDWEKFRMFAMEQRISITRLFSILLGNWKNDISGVPTDFNYFSRIVSLTINFQYSYLKFSRLNL